MDQRRTRRRSFSGRVSAGVPLIGSLAFVSLLAAAGSAEAPRFWPPVRSSIGLTRAVAPGVWYSRFSLRTAAGPLSIHHLRVDLGNPFVRLDLGLAHNRLISGDETVSSMVTRSGAVAGVNGDFFDIGDSGMPLNIVVRDGRLIRSPSGWVALGIGKDRSARIVRYRWTGTLALPAAGVSHWLTGLNTGMPVNGIVVLSNTRGYGAPVPAPGIRQTVVELAPEGDPGPPLVTAAGDPAPSGPPAPPLDGPGRYVAKRVFVGEPYYAPFPRGYLLAVGRGDAADWLQRAVTPGTPVDVNLTTEPDWRPMAATVGGGPLLVRGGRIVDDPLSPVPHERDRRNPVIAAGLTRDRKTMLLVEVDGRQPRTSVGLTQPQLASYMQWLGVDDAMAFDSGGSATVAVRWPGRLYAAVMNSPSDGRERPVGTALLVFSGQTSAALPGGARR